MGKKKAQKEIDDDRFAAATNRPQFQNRREKHTKVVLDDRFASVLTDPRFSIEPRDKYGRSKKNKERQPQDHELSEFYQVEKDEKEEHHKLEKEASDEDSSSSATSSDHEEEGKPEDPASRIAYLTALSRGEIDLSSSSEDESDSSGEDSDDSDRDDDDSSAAGVLDPSAKEEVEVDLTHEPSKYLAVMNMDWTHVRAVDLFAMLSSFAPLGSIRRVQVYPSDFGMKRMAREDTYGPSDIWKDKTKERGDSSDVAVDDNDSVYSDNEEEPRDVNPNAVDSDYDPEKLRTYEASKLKYFFAVVEFSSSDHADVAYREVDGIELEHSSAAIDLRSIPPGDLDSVIQNRTLRDEATAVPSNYEPPEFVVSALQQTSVQCTWEEGDTEREQKLTGYGNREAGNWNELGGGDDLRAFLASDVSSDEDSDNDNEKRGSKMRSLLGLDSGDDGGNDVASYNDGASETEDSSEGDEADDFSKVATFVPGKHKLEDKIRSKIESSREESSELTPWQKYREKRKEKKRERRRAARNKNKGTDVDNESMYESNRDGLDNNDHVGSIDNDNFFLDENTQLRRKQSSDEGPRDETLDHNDSDKTPSTKAELELLLAGDNREELAKDYDMRGLLRVSKNKDKKLRGSRKRKDVELAANVSGADFKIDTKDERFAAVLDGNDDRFGIDRTDPNFKETPAMREILSVQSKRRKAKKAKRKVVANVSADSAEQPSTGATALSSLVRSLKSKASKTGQ